MPYIKKVKLPNSDTIYNIYDDEAAHMSDEPVFALEDSEDIYADTINADTLQGHVANDFVRVLDTSANTETAPLNADTFGGRTPDEYATQEELNALTAADVGAAPAGYGLGEETGRHITDFNAAKRPGFYHCNNAINAPAEESAMAYGTLLVEVRAPMIKQTLFYNGLQAVRYSGDNGKTWQPWEWFNPPMVGQIEYRTTERWNNKAVYTKLVNYGGMPGYTTYSIAHGCAATCILRYCAVNETLGIAIPNSTTSIAVDKNNISLTTNTTDVKGNIARIQIWYTKD